MRIALVGFYPDKFAGKSPSEACADLRQALAADVAFMSEKDASVNLAGVDAVVTDDVNFFRRMRVGSLGMNTSTLPVLLYRPPLASLQEPERGEREDAEAQFQKDMVQKTSSMESVKARLAEYGEYELLLQQGGEMLPILQRLAMPHHVAGEVVLGGPRPDRTRGIQ